MRLAFITTQSDKHSIFCRGCDKGRPAGGCTRDLDSEGRQDIYCAKCTKQFSANVVSDEVTE